MNIDMFLRKFRTIISSIFFLQAHQGDYGLYEESLDLESLGGSIGVTESESWSVSSTDDSECYYDSSESESRKRASYRKGRRSSQSLNQQHRYLNSNFLKISFNTFTSYVPVLKAHSAIKNKS